MKRARPKKDTVTTTVRLPADVYEGLREAAFRERRSQNEIIREALEEKLGLRKPDEYGGDA